MIQAWKSHSSSSFSSSGRSRSSGRATRGSTRQTGAGTSRDEIRLPAAVAFAVGGRGTISIRRALPTDDRALGRLAELADRRLPVGPLVVAEVEGEIVAAVAAAGGEVVSDPFRVTLDVTELLRLRTSQLRAAA